MKIEAEVFWDDENQRIKFAWPYEKNYNSISFNLNLKGGGYGRIDH